MFDLVYICRLRNLVRHHRRIEITQYRKPAAGNRFVAIDPERCSTDLADGRNRFARRKHFEWRR
jgi:hypothetical protein